jgi:hypothetical protein
MAALLQKTAFSGATATKKASRASASRAPLVVRAQKQNVEAPELSRRALMGVLAGAAAMGAAPAFAAYGDSANVFGKVTNKSGFVPYAGEGFALLLPSKYNPSKEKEFDNIVLRYEDNGDAVNNLMVIAAPADGKSKIDDFGAPDKFLESVSYLFGKQAFAGETVSEGGFAPNRVSAASLLDVSESTDKKGRKYYEYDLLARGADGNEGGRHTLIKATVANGKLYILKVQVGDKRWFKGAKNEALGTFNSFTVA